MKRIWLISRSGIYPILHIWLLLSAQLCCRIKLVYFWVHINVILTCVIVENFSWPSVFQDIITNNAYGSILVNINFPNTDFIGPVTESWRYMLSPLLPGDRTWHYVYLTWPCLGFLINFQDDIFYESVYVSFWLIMQYTDLVIANGAFNERYGKNATFVDLRIQDTVIKDII